VVTPAAQRHECDATRVVRIISRLNVGGPAIQAITLTKLLEERGFSTRLVRGREGSAEGNMDHLARELGVRSTLVRTLGREPGFGDLQALGALARILRAERPRIVHTHTAKAGALGRLAALLAYPRGAGLGKDGPGCGPRLVHTYHGHSLTGYFGAPTAAFYRRTEAWLAARTDALVAVSGEVADELAGLGVAARERFTVIPLGFDLAPFADDHDRAGRRTRMRDELQIESEAELVTLVARLVPIKRVDRFLRVAQLLATRRPRARFLIVGDGELRNRLVHSAEAQMLESKLTWAGLRRDMPDIYVASDVVVLSSDNEGTPVSLIEAQATATPVVGTDVGGMRAAVRDGETGLLATPHDERSLASAIACLLDDRALASRLAQAGRVHVLNAFGLERLLDDIERLYVRLTARPSSSSGSMRAAPRD
jgi:glycosyltransferase involved in cell wall biosynthesis